MNRIEIENDKIYIKNAKNFELEQTLDCGQAFRWRKNANGSWSGIAANRSITLEKCGNDIIISGTNEQDFQTFWYDYFDLERDYEEIIKTVSDNETVCKAAQYGCGIRILRQEPWETLCSFIISQNNNIPRIKGIIERLCEIFGEKTDGGFSFPSADVISSLSVEDLAPLRCGFRAKYIIDAALKVSSGVVDLESLKHTDADTARNKLMLIKGVGPKVADCVLLFGLGHIEAFPQDVWIKRALVELFDGDIPQSSKRYAGIVQQYIFYYIRNKEKSSV